MNDIEATRDGTSVAQFDARLREHLVERLAASSPPPAPPPAPTPDTDDEPLFSFEPFQRIVQIIRDSFARRRLLACVVFAGVLLLGGMAFGSAPADYRTTATVLLAGDGSVGGTDGTTASAARQAEAVVLNDELLDEMIVDLELAENEAPLPMFGQLRESMFAPIFGSPSLADVRRTMRDTLSTSIIVSRNEEANLAITVFWPDPDQAVAIAQRSYDNFLASRRTLEVEPLERSVAMLTQRAAEATTAVDALRDELRLTPSDGAQAGSALEGLVRAEQDLLDQLRIAQNELTAAEAGVTTRYALIAPPERPDTPATGNLTGYALAAIMAAIVTAIVLYLRGRPNGRLAHEWQLDSMGVPVLGTVTAQNRSLW
ncbi:MAG: hypothetical protein AAGG08_02950 [Actinomycetota bacterium]